MSRQLSSWRPPLARREKVLQYALRLQQQQGGARPPGQENMLTCLGELFAQVGRERA